MSMTAYFRSAAATREGATYAGESDPYRTPRVEDED